jgi:general secretion pathway protein J
MDTAMSGRDRATCSGGFTLIEVLIALTLLAVVSLIVLHAGRLAAFGLNRFAAAADRLDDRRSVNELLRREISATIAAPLSAVDTPFSGTETQIRLLTLAPTDGAGLYRVEIGFDPRDPERPLVLTRRPAVAVAGRTVERVVLARNVQSFRLLYFGATSSDGVARWRPTWSEPRFPPQLVSIAFADGDAASRPPLVIRVWSAPG